MRPSGPLSGLHVVELAGLGPAPFAAMVLADMGADVVRVERAGYRHDFEHEPDFLCRGRRSIAVNLKHPDGVEALLRLAERSDVLLEGFRPGVAERLGVGPDECLARNQRLVYGRVTGWGQDGSYAQAPGHDINYIALSGALHLFGYPDRPPLPPTNLVGDMGGGGLLLVAGVMAALWECGRSGKGQVVDAAMVDGAALMMTMIFSRMAAGLWDDRRGANDMQGAAPFYTVYETADHHYVSVAAAEQVFFDALAEVLGLDADAWSDRLDPASWPAHRAELAAIFSTRTRDDWCEVFEGTQACVAPVLSPAEAPDHPHNKYRQTFTEVGGVVQPAPAPRFSRTRTAVPGVPPVKGRHTREVLAECGYSPAETGRLIADGAVGTGDDGS